MSKIHSSNTKFEKNFVVELKKKTKKKFKINVWDLRGKPDIVFQKEKICVFLDSDFWHGWQYSRWKHLLKNNFWRDKIANNRRRDKKVTLYLRKHGWEVLRFWGHEIENNSEKVINKIIKSLK